MTSLIPKTIELIKQVVLDPIASYNQAVLNPVSLFAGRTLLVPKCEQAIFGRQFRPITCLVSIQKIISKVYTTLLEEMIESNQLISINQYGTRKRVQASKELALINKCLINTAHHHHSSAPLRSTWIDIEKAYDSVNHQYLLDVLRSMKIPVFIVDY
ncbi:Reverse transcriptase-like protein, partial [Sarcoptes scabiei]